MASSSLISSSPNPVTNGADHRPQSRKKIRRKNKIFSQAKRDGGTAAAATDLAHQAQTWKSEAQQQIYSSKFLKALSHVTIGHGAAPAAAPCRGRAVREAADRVLAAAAKGRTRWSRAILTNRLKLKFRKKKRQRIPMAAAATGNSRSTKKPRVSVYRLKGKSLQAVQRKVRVLGRLVPGCRKQPLPVILEEVTDYIPALEMQVRAMSALLELLSGGSSSGTGGAGSNSAPPT